MDTFRSPLEERFASKEMLKLWSPQKKFSTWRRLWLALAVSEKKLGVAGISDEQIEELREHLDDIDFQAAAKYEKELRHDVMAHVHALGDVCPKARPIIHLGATSQFVVCNTELLQIRDSLTLIAGKLARVISQLGQFALKYKDVPTLGYTHFQAAQPTTVGKRAVMWAQDFVAALEDIEYRLDTLKFRGIKGATGTQASFLCLFDGDGSKVAELDKLVAEEMGWPRDRVYTITGQTYPRILDAQVITTLSIAAVAVHRCCNDIRLLAHEKEIEEPFEEHQIGSSAMPYKRNPTRCERGTGLARFVIAAVQNPLMTAATQWLERTLDDSANRRLALPETFLALDAALEVMVNVTGGLVVYERTIAANLEKELPFLATENILMSAVKKGADRQDVHEVIRKHSQDAAKKMKMEAGENDLLSRLESEPVFAGVDLKAVCNPSDYVGLAPSQVQHFYDDVIAPIASKYSAAFSASSDLRV